VNGQRLPAHAQLARVGGREAEEHAGQLRPAGAHQAGQAHDLARADVEIHVADTAHPARQAARGEHDVADRDRPLGEHRVEVASDHRSDQVRLREPRRRSRLHGGAVAQDGHAVGGPQHLGQAVRDVHDADPGRAQLRHQREQALRFRLREGSGRLVHDDDARLGAEGARDLHELLLGHAQGTRVRVRIDARSHPGQQRRRALPPLAPVDAAPGASRLQAEGQVLGDGQLGEQGGLLVDRRHPEAPREQRVRAIEGLPGDADGARIRGVSPRDDLDQRALARAVFAHQRVHLARPHVEVHAAQRAHGAERLGDAAEVEDRVHLYCGPPPMWKTSRSADETGLSSAFAGMTSFMCRHQRRQTSVEAIAAQRSSLSISAYPKRSRVAGSRKIE
jgi:hypothetical protein